MGSSVPEIDLQHLCRLCLVRDQVTVPIFGGDDQPSHKINCCLPVKVSQDDNLPKKICDGCSYKLDMLYTFRNTSAESERQLIQWLSEAGLSTTSSNEVTTSDRTSSVKDPLAATKTEVTVKQETFDVNDIRTEGESEQELDTSYLIQQGFEFAEASGSATELIEEPPAKRTRRMPILKKAPPEEETEEAEDDDMDATMAVTKAEDEDSDEMDQPDYVEAPSTSADDQPGPSGVGKAPVEAPPGLNYSCNICRSEFVTKLAFLQHHLNQYGETFNCCKCGGKFSTTSDLYAHLEVHKAEVALMEGPEEVIEEIVLNYEPEPGNNEVIYLLEDGSQCVNEVVIEEEEVVEENPNNSVTIVQLEHGYVMPSNQELKNKRKSPVKKPPTKPSSSQLTPQSKLPEVIQRRRNIVPDFSSTNYIYINATKEIDMPHYRCLRCEQIFINKFGFFRHIEKGKCYINHCDICSDTFEKNSEFYNHYMTSHQERAICNFCFRTFMYEKNVKEHMLRHLDQFRHRCDECNKGFFTVREYRNHYKNRHMGIRHTCEVCGRSFADEYYFKKHVATHDKSVTTIE